MVTACSRPRSRTQRRPANRCDAARRRLSQLGRGEVGPHDDAALAVLDLVEPAGQAGAEQRPHPGRRRLRGHLERAGRPLCDSRKPTSGWARASRITASVTWDASVASPRRNFSRAGTLASRSRTTTWVPGGAPAAPVADDRAVVDGDRDRGVDAALAGW
jgi:hypothetical protein